MLFELVKKVSTAKVGKVEKRYSNFYLVNSETGIRLPIEIKVFKKGEQIINRSDFAIALKVAKYEKSENEENN